MKAISVVSPAGQLIASGKKTLEIRKWIPDISANEPLLIVENLNYLINEGQVDIGRALAVVNIKAVRPFIPDDMEAACASYFEEGWLAWEMINVRPVISLLPVSAERKIYNVALPKGAY